MVAVVVALVMTSVPVLPSFAMMADNTDIHAGHVFHDANAGKTPDVSVPDQAPCPQHDSCIGQCCAFCAQSFGAVSLFSPDQPQSQPLRISILTKLHPRLLATSPERPPRFLFT